MQQQQLDGFRVWFDNYVAGFYSDDEFVNANIKLKEEHTHRVCEEMRYLADELGLSEDDRRLAETIALFHDIGRFEQFVRYRTYSDPKSVSHPLLGVDILRETGVLSPLAGDQRQLIEKAVEYHGIKEMPKDIDGRCLLFSKLIRDADKLDVYYTVITYYRQYKEDPGGFKLELELPDEPGYTDIVIENILNEQQTDYQKLKTLNDMKLLQLGWVYDVNFTATLKRISKCGYLKMLIDLLPQTEDIEKVSEKILTYVDRRIEQAG